MASSPPGNYADATVDYAWDGDGRWYMVGQWMDLGGGTQCWRYDGEGRGVTDGQPNGTGWSRVLHIPPPQGYYCHGFAYALHVGKIKIICRDQAKREISGWDVPGARRFAQIAPL